ncbi:MAG TPA: hypothetical protein DHV51_05685 [Opitutae bacterium]|nr:hypothetical protein [Opitutae bacterium]
MNIEDISKKPNIPGTGLPLDEVKGGIRKALSDKVLEVSHLEDELGIELLQLARKEGGFVMGALTEQACRDMIDQFCFGQARQKLEVGVETLLRGEGLEGKALENLQAAKVIIYQNVAQGVRELCSKYTKSLESVESFTALLKG